MKFAILIEDYNLFYTNSFSQQPELNSNSYSKNLNMLLGKKYYQSDSLAQALIKQGHQAEIIIPSCNPLQLSWAKENNRQLYLKWHLKSPVRSIQSRLLRKFDTFTSIRSEILVAQLEALKPDVVFIYSGIWLEEKTIQKIKSIAKKIILQWSCPIAHWTNFPFHQFDSIVSSSMSLVNYFNQRKAKAHYLQQAFDDDILKNNPHKNERIKDLVFIGNFTLYHDYRFEVIEYLLKNGINIDVFGSGAENMPADSLLRKKIKPPLQGMEMHKTYTKYKLALHIHGEGSKDDGVDLSAYAGAKRNFEITGSGTALLTSYQENLSELFNENEVISFHTKEECLKKITYFLSKNDLLRQVAIAGQERTLNEHTFKNRAQELLKIINHSGS